ncbi:18047_t:CDS:2, partial [Entrophospora sp. SA101]
PKIAKKYNIPIKLHLKQVLKEFNMLLSDQIPFLGEMADFKEPL